MIKALLQKTWNTLNQNLVLFLPPILLNLFIDIVFSINSQSKLSFIVIFSTSLLYIAMIAGLLNQMKIILMESKKVNFNDFLEGIAKYFFTLIKGNFSLILILSTLMFILAGMASFLVGIPDIEKFKKLLESSSNIDNHMSLEITIWGGIFIIWFIFSVVFTFIILFWQHYCIIQDLSWFKGWQKSKDTVFKNFSVSLILYSIQLFSIIFINSLGVLTQNIVINLLLYVLMIFLITFFNLLYSQFVVDKINSDLL